MSEVWRSMAEGMAFGRDWREKNLAEQKRSRLAELAQGVFQNDPKATMEAYSLDPNTAKAYTDGADRQHQIFKTLALQIKQAPTPDLRARIYAMYAPQLKQILPDAPDQWDESYLPMVDQVIAQAGYLQDDKAETWSNAGNGLMTSNRGNAKKIPGFEPKGPSLRPVMVPQADGSAVQMNFNPATGEYSMPNYGQQAPAGNGSMLAADGSQINLADDVTDYERQLIFNNPQLFQDGAVIQGPPQFAGGGMGVRPPKPSKGPQERQPPPGYRWTAKGDLEVIPGGPADRTSPRSGQRAVKSPTEDQAKAAGWYDQALNGFNNMEKARTADQNAEYPSGLESFNTIADYLVPDGLVNYTRSPSRQQYLQGSSALTEAVLRAATGAAITREEALQKARELTPQPGDSREVVEQKRESLKVYLESLKRRGAPALGTQQAQMPAGDLSGLSDDELKRQLGL